MIEIKDVSVSFAAGHTVQAVNNVSLSIKQGQKTALIGETGSGKSVLLLAVLRLLPKNANITGSVMYHERDLLRLSEKELQRVRGAQIGYVPQGNGNSLNPLMTIGTQIGEPLVQHRGYSKKRAFAESIGLLKRFHIGNEEKRAKSYPHTYSGGMRQRALVAMGISAGAELILADEPTKGLDEQKVAQVEEALLSLSEQAVLCVTHDINFAGAVAQYIGVMYASYLVEYAPKGVLLTNPLHPYTRDMIRAMPENGLQAETGFTPSQTKASGCLYKSRCSDCAERCDRVPPVFELEGGHKVRCWKYAD